MIGIATNRPAMRALADHARATRDLSDIFRKMSSGMRIERAADDPTGLAVAENLNTRVRSQRMAMKNTMNGVSVIQTAEGALNEIVEMVKRMRELAIQSASETMHDNERVYINDEFKQLQSEISRVRDATQFNGLKLIDGSMSTGMNVQVGANNTLNDRIAIRTGDVELVGAKIVGTSVASALVTDIKLRQEGGAWTDVKVEPAHFDANSRPGTELTSGTARANAINASTDSHGVTASAGASSFTSGIPIAKGFGPVNGTIVVDDGLSASFNITGLNLLAGDADGALQAAMQAGFDSTDPGVYTVDTSSGAVKVTAIDGRNFRVSGGITLTDAGLNGSFEGLSELTLTSDGHFEHQFTQPDWGFWGIGSSVKSRNIVLQSSASVLTSANAIKSLEVIDLGLDSLNKKRVEMGTVENRLMSAYRNLASSTENLEHATSRIQDADFAYLSAKMAKTKVMQDASLAVLGQANQLSQQMLRLLQ